MEYRRFINAFNVSGPYFLVLVLAAYHYWGVPGVYMGLSVSFFFIPVVWATIPQGMRGGLFTSVLSALLLAPHYILVHGPILQIIEAGEISVIMASGILIGWGVDRERRQRGFLQALNHVAVTATETLNPSRILEDSLGNVLSELALDAGWIYLAQEGTSELVISAQRGLSPKIVEEKGRLHLGEGRDGLVARGGQARIFKDVSEGEALGISEPKRTGRVTVFVTPMRSREKLLGTLGVASRSPRSLGREQQGLLMAMGNVITVALDNAMSYEKESKTLNELTLSEQKYRDIFEKASDAILLLNSRGRVVDANESACRFTGYSRKELLGKSLGDLLPGDGDREFFRRGIERSVERELVSKDGVKRDVEISRAVMPSSGSPGVVQVVIRDLTEQRLAQRNLQQYIAAITKAQEEERKRVARELHDDTAQALVTLSRRFDSLVSRGDSLPEDVRAQLGEMWDLTNHTLQGVRRFSQDLRPSVLDDLGLIPALEWLSDRLTILNSMKAQVQVTGKPRRLSSEQELALFRIVQEALSNVAKHSGAREATVRVAYGEGRVMVRVTDDGIGFQVPALTGEMATRGQLGLLGMRERAQLVGGLLDVRSEPGKGTEITVEVPA